MKDIIEPLRLILMNASLRHILPPFAVLAAVIISAVSCGRSQHERSIAVADSLVEADQRAAITYIDSIASPSRGSLPRSVRMKLALLRAKAMNKLMLSDYFADHGTPNERMLATYILGCSFVVNKDAPTALEYFHEAAAMADTTAADCDWRTLHKVHAQAGMLLFSQDALRDADEEYKLAYKYALKAKDTLNALITVEQKANIYMLEGKMDSCIRLRKKLHALYLQHGYAENAAMSLGPVIDNLAEMGKLDEAKHYLDNFEKNSGLFDSLGNIERGREIHYYIKGMYYLEAGRLDSAEYLFRKCISSAVHRSAIMQAYKGLMRLYKKIDNPDSVAKYAELARVTQDTVNIMKATLHLQQMQAMYNYSTSERMAERKTAEAVKYKYTAAILVIAFALAVFIILFIQQKRKKELERAKQINATNAMYMALLGKKEKELEAASNDKIKNEKLINEKKEEIRQLEEKLSALRDGDFNILRRDKSLIFDAPIIERLHELAGSSSKASVADVGCLRKHADDFMPDFMRSLNIAVNGLGSVEVEVCILIKLQFMTSEISCLLGISPQRLTNIRKRLNMKIFGKDGGAKEFDQRLRQYFPAS